MKIRQPLFVAIQFLTRIPVPAMDNIEEKTIGRSMLFYPIVGLIIGLFLLAIAWSTSGASSLVSSALILTVWVLITGALHLDGLADSADAWIGGNGDKARTLTIMKDPSSGPVAVVILLLVLLLKFVAIEAIVSSGQLMLLILAPVISRTFMPLLLLTTPYVRNNGLGTAMVEHLPTKKSIIMLCIATCVFSFLFGKAGIMAIIFSSICFLLLRKLMMKRIDGTTGDTAGAMLETIETVAITAIALILTNA